VENGYLQALRRELEQRKRYPSGRQASLERPQGNVEVWLEVDRSGRCAGFRYCQQGAEHAALALRLVPCKASAS
jgi:outer membrane biosynthesis protein TonB